jgi:malonate decarboxylase beta subunit
LIIEVRAERAVVTQRSARSGNRAAAKAVLANIPVFDLKTMQMGHERLAAREKRFGACDDAVSMWRILGIKDPEAIRDMDSKDFAALAKSGRERAPAPLE